MSYEDGSDHVVGWHDRRPSVGYYAMYVNGGMVVRTVDAGAGNAAIGVGPSRGFVYSGATLSGGVELAVIVMAYVNTSTAPATIYCADRWPLVIGNPDGSSVIQSGELATVRDGWNDGELHVVAIRIHDGIGSLSVDGEQAAEYVPGSALLSFGVIQLGGQLALATVPGEGGVATMVGAIAEVVVVRRVLDETAIGHLRGYFRERYGRTF